MSHSDERERERERLMVVHVPPSTGGSEHPTSVLSGGGSAIEFMLTCEIQMTHRNEGRASNPGLWVGLLHSQPHSGWWRPKKICEDMFFFGNVVVINSV